VSVCQISNKLTHSLKHDINIMPLDFNVTPISCVERAKFEEGENLL